MDIETIKLLFKENNNKIRKIFPWYLGFYDRKEFNQIEDLLNAGLR